MTKHSPSKQRQAIPTKAHPKQLSSVYIYEFVRCFKYSLCDEALTGAEVSGAVANTLLVQAARIGENGLR